MEFESEYLGTDFFFEGTRARIILEFSLCSAAREALPYYIGEYLTTKQVGKILSTIRNRNELVD